MKNLKKITIILMLIAMVMALIPTNVKAAAGAFSLNKSSASLNIGGTTTVTVTIANCEGKFTVSSSNTNVATVSTSSFWGDEKGTTITITAKSAGTANINIKAVDVTDTDLNDVVGTRTCKVTVTAPAPKPEAEPEKPTTPSTNTGTTTNKPTTSTTTKPSASTNTSTSTTKPSTNTTPEVKKSSNSKLSSLQITEGTITPIFNSATTEYGVSVPNEITKLSVSATAEDSKSTVNITGNDELQVGDNNIEIVVTAEDGSKTTYKVLAKRAQPALSMQTLSAGYINENGEKIELILNPAFSFDIYEYVIDTVIPHNINNLEILGTANRENAKIEITGNEELKAGENEITIKVTVTNEAGLEEQKTYKIKVQKEEEPVVAPLTTMDKIGKWFNGIGITISTWVSENFEKLITGMLIFSTVAFVGLTIYFAYDYKNYQKLLAKLAEINKANLMEKANVALNPENASRTEETNDIENTNAQDVTTNISTDETTRPEIKFSRGRRFK